MNTIKSFFKKPETTKNTMPKLFKDTCEMCGKKDDSVGLATGENAEECWVCENCDVDGYNYNGWGESCFSESDDE
jgi:hypothetical protein